MADPSSADHSSTPVWDYSTCPFRPAQESAQGLELAGVVSRLEAELQVLHVRLKAVEAASSQETLHSKEFQAVLACLQEVLLQRRELEQPASLQLTYQEQLRRAATAAAGFAQGALSKADVACLFLARKLLLDPAPLAPASATSLDPGPLKNSLARTLGAALFLAALEVAYQADSRYARHLPPRTARSLLPISQGLKGLRFCAWLSACLLTAAGVRQTCFQAAFWACSRALREAQCAGNFLKLWCLPVLATGADSKDASPQEGRGAKRERIRKA